jgi:D-alanine-D-alanine ligase
VIEQSRAEAARRVGRDGREAHMVAHPGAEQIMTIDRGSTPQVAGLALDVVFPVLHGPYGEDGTVQGLLELANVPYVGAGVLASSVGMDKAAAKMIFAARGLPLAKYLVVLRNEWTAAPGRITSDVTRQLGYPVFVKPANLGSSVGISKAKSEAALAAAIDTAAEFDRKIVIEAGVPNAREIECAVLGNDDPEASMPGEIVVTHRDGFYSYTAKYIDPDGAVTKVPADLPQPVIDRVRRLSVEAFKALELAGMARVDFFVDAKTDALYLNEVNTIPGFTSISMYPKMWEATGLPYPQLLERLLTLALDRHAEKQRLQTSIT